MTRPLRILHYTGVYAPAWSIGGPTRSVSSLCAGLAALGHTVTVLTTNAGLQGRADIPTDRAVIREGVAVRYFPAVYDWMGLQSPALEAAVAAEASACDIVHVTGVWQPTSRAACRAARRAGRPYVCSPRGALGRYSFTQKSWKKLPYFWLWERPNLAGAAALHYTSAMERAECGRFGLKPPGFVVPNSIDLAAWRRNEAAGQAWRQAQAVGAGELLLLYAGRLHHKKGLELLAEIAAALPAGAAWKFALVGHDEDGTGGLLRQAFAAAGLSSRLLILPGVETAQLAAVYSAADVFVFPSRHENFGNVVVEALACGCPVLLSDQIGVADQLAGLPGVAVRPRQAAAWASAITERLPRRTAPVAPLAEPVAARFSAAAVATRMAQHYQELLPA